MFFCGDSFIIAGSEVGIEKREQIGGTGGEEKFYIYTSLVDMDIYIFFFASLP